LVTAEFGDHRREDHSKAGVSGAAIDFGRFTCLGLVTRRARNDTRFWRALALKPDEKVSVEDPLEMERLADALPVERAVSPFLQDLPRFGVSVLSACTSGLCNGLRI
jgi:hypothetical protein